MTNTPPPDQSTSQGRLSIDPRLDAVTTRSSAASREGSLTQTILKLQPYSSLDHRVCYEPKPHIFSGPDNFPRVPLESGNTQYHLTFR